MFLKKKSRLYEGCHILKQLSKENKTSLENECF